MGSLWLMARRASVSWILSVKAVWREFQVIKDVRRNDIAPKDGLMAGGIFSNRFSMMSWTRTRSGWVSSVSPEMIPYLETSPALTSQQPRMVDRVVSNWRRSWERPFLRRLG